MAADDAAFILRAILRAEARAARKRRLAGAGMLMLGMLIAGAVWMIRGVLP